MKRFNLSGPQVIMALMIRRKWWIIYPFLALSLAVLLLTHLLPRMYVSQSLVLIQTRDVPSDFVKDLLAGSTAQRLTVIKETVLSRTNLLEILREFEGRIPEYKKMNLEEKVADLRSKIDLDFVTGGNIAGEVLPVSYFTISYRNRDPEVAQKITEKVTSVFIKQDSMTREAKVNGTVSFLKDKLDQISVQLDASETKKRNLKAKNLNQLPEQMTTNIAMLTTLTAQRRDNLEATDRWLTTLAGVDRELAITDKTLVRAKPPVIAPATPRNPLLDEYVKAQSVLEALIANGLKPSHPDVILATNNLERLKSQLTPDELASLAVKNDKPPVAAPTDDSIPNPAYSNLIRQKEGIETELKIRRENLEKTEEGIAMYKRYIENAPKSEQEIADVLRENADLTKQYQELNDKLTQAQLSEDLETRQQGSQFKIQDPANLPLSPTKPAKPAIAATGIMFSLLLSIALAFIVDIANQKMWTLSDVESLLGTTVLVEIPEIVTSADLSATRRSKRIHLASFAVCSVVYGACLYLTYIHQSFVMNQLEPVIRRLY
jgi:polysaccharide chain length determinant protein (PEP-CTERM system associated)